jgi:quercetin dioxygenase-like cupin family protein
MKRITRILVPSAVLLAGSLFVLHSQTQKHVLDSPDMVQWGPAPPLIPAGAQIAVLSGNPMGAGSYSIRLKFPANYAIPAHSHPTDENVVVVSGAVTFGMGDKLAKDAAGNKTLSVGGYALMPAGMNHYAFTSGEETTIILYGQGPVEFKYVNPTDDPRNAKSAAK